MNIIIPQYTLDFIKKEEGFSIKAYQDSNKQWTIGYGISFYPDTENPVKKNDIIDEKKAEQDLYKYICKHCLKDVKDIALSLNKTNSNNINMMNEFQITAIVSVSYNVCNPKFRYSKCKKAIMNGDVEQACQEWSWGVFDTKNPGLKQRRNKEIQMFYGIKNYWK